jgi:hypothetical protein
VHFRRQFGIGMDSLSLFCLSPNLYFPYSLFGGFLMLIKLTQNFVNNELQCPEGKARIE